MVRPLFNPNPTRSLRVALSSPRYLLELIEPQAAACGAKKVSHKKPYATYTDGLSYLRSVRICLLTSYRPARSAVVTDRKAITLMFTSSGSRSRLGATCIHKHGL